MPKYSTWVGRRVGALQDLRDPGFTIVCRAGEVATIISYTHRLKLELDVDGLYLSNIPLSAVYLIDQPESLRDRILCYFGSHESATSAMLCNDLKVKSSSVSAAVYQLRHQGILQVMDGKEGPRGGIVYKPAFKLCTQVEVFKPKTALERLLTDDFLGP